LHLVAPPYVACFVFFPFSSFSLRVVAAIQAEQRLLGTPEASPGASLPLFSFLLLLFSTTAAGRRDEHCGSARLAL
jgi:hypothetical protein